MNGSTGTLLVVGMIGLAIPLLLSVTSVWDRSRRARRLALIDGVIAASYVDPVRVVDPSLPHEDAEPFDPVPVRELRPVLDAAAFDAVIADEDAREARYRRPTTVVSLELDGLDRLISRLGVNAAQRIEPDVADTIAREARRADYVARLAPGRFAVLMPETDEIMAINFVERIRDACDQWLESGAIAMRLAIGWASTSGHASVSTAMQVALDRMEDERRRHARFGADGPSGDAPAA
jgi:diguanylate cyclase (GGDEF)-like protein